MSDEQKELLARISQVAGQINRHKNKLSDVLKSEGAREIQGPSSRWRGVSSPHGGAPRGRPHFAHRNRTLHLNHGNIHAAHDVKGDGGPTAQNNWVSRNDRHRQLINASVYEKEAQSRFNALAETRLRKLKLRKMRERKLFDKFLGQTTTVDTPTNPAERTGSRVIVIEGIQFRVIDGSRKLVKDQGDRNNAITTPKTVTVAGITFHRTKSGNLIAQRVVDDQRHSDVVKKTNEPCRTFSSTGSCPKGPACRYQHDPRRVAVCKDFLRTGSCVNGESCDLSHELTPERVPNCFHFAKGHCAKTDCPFTHSAAPPSAAICAAFGFLGYCSKGASCRERHVFECPDFSNKGLCKTKGCKLLHRERASLLRLRATPQEGMEDVSSGDESVDSDDVDSDDVAEFVKAESDEDAEAYPDYLPL